MDETRERRPSMRLEYEKPTVTDFGPITDHTFTTPGGVKGCTVNCHLDSFSENSSLSGG